MDVINLTGNTSNDDTPPRRRRQQQRKGVKQPSRAQRGRYKAAYRVQPPQPGFRTGAARGRNGRNGTTRNGIARKLTYKASTRPSRSTKQVKTKLVVPGTNAAAVTVYRPAELPVRRDPGSSTAAARNSPWLQTRFGNFALQAHQINVCKLFVKTPGLLLYYKVGSGKTLASIAAVHNLARYEEARGQGLGFRRPVVVVVPASLVPNYEKELRAALPLPQTRARFTILSYHALHALVSRPPAKLANGRIDAAKENERRAKLRAMRDAVLVLDEVQTVRNVRGIMLASLLQVASRTYKRLLLSGTPVMNYPEDLGPVLGLLNPDFVPSSVGFFPPGYFENFAARVNVNVVQRPSPRSPARNNAPRNNTRNYTRNNGSWYNASGNGLPKKSPVVAQWRMLYGRDATRNRDALASMLRCASLFYEPDPETVRLEYPSKTEFWVDIPLTSRQTRAQFAQARENPGAANIEELIAEKMSVAFLTNPREINSWFGRDHPKIDAIVNAVATEYAVGGKCVVFSQYVEHGLSRISELLEQRGVAHDVYSGDVVSKAEKAAIVARYNSEITRVLLLSDAGKEGLDLKNTSQLHILEPGWNEEKIAQVVGRVVRYRSHIGRRKHVNVFRYCAVLPEGYQRYYRGDDDPSRSLLFRMTADEALKQYTERKNATNQEFLRWLVDISDNNLRTCL